MENKEYDYAAKLLGSVLQVSPKRYDLMKKIGIANAAMGNHREALSFFIEAGKKSNATIHEFILWADKKTVLERSEKRGFKKMTIKDAEDFWELCNKFKKQRTNAIVIDASKDTPDEITNVILNLIQDPQSKKTLS